MLKLQSVNVCMHVCTYVRMYVCMYAWIDECMYVCMYVCVSVCMYVFMYVLIRVFVHVCTKKSVKRSRKHYFQACEGAWAATAFIVCVFCKNKQNSRRPIPCVRHNYSYVRHETFPSVAQIAYTFAMVTR